GEQRWRARKMQLSGLIARSHKSAATHNGVHQVNRRAAPRRTVHRLAGSVRLFLMSDEQQDKTPQTAAVLWARYSQIAFIIPAAVVVGLLVGKLLDYWFHTRWLFLVGVILGAIAGFVELIRTVTRDKGLRSE